MLSWAVHLRGGPKIADHAAVAVGLKVYSFGRVYGGEAHTPNREDQMHVHVFNTVSLRWTKLPPVTTGRGEAPAEVPCWRFGHTAVLMEDVVYICGGLSTTHRYCNELQAFDVDAHRWFKPDVSGNVPKGRCWHSACALGKAMYIYGAGKIFAGKDNEIHKLDTATMVWSLINVRGTPPPASCNHSATIIGTRMFVFGGIGEEYDHNNDIRVFDTETNSWLDVPSSRLLPEGREDHSAFAYEGELYVFGGCTWDWGFKDLWKFNPETFSWKKLQPKGKRPCGISGMCCCMVGESIVLFGGYRTDSFEDGDGDGYEIEFGDLEVDAEDDIENEYEIELEVEDGYDIELEVEDAYESQDEVEDVIEDEVEGESDVEEEVEVEIEYDLDAQDLGEGATADDLYILDLSPSLKTLCRLAVIQYGLEQSELPHDIRWELSAMTSYSNR